jgi:hypothetical protein
MLLQRRAAYVRALSSATTVSAMRDKRLDVSVRPAARLFHHRSELPQSVTALSLGGLRRLPDEPVVQLRLDRAARLEARPASPFSASFEAGSDRASAVRLPWLRLFGNFFRAVRSSARRLTAPFHGERGMATRSRSASIAELAGKSR